MLELLIRDQWMFLNLEEHPSEVSVLFLCSLDYLSRLGIGFPHAFLPNPMGVTVPWISHIGSPQQR